MQYVKRAVHSIEGLAALFLAAIMIISVSDFLLRSINPSWRIFGVVEMVQFAFGGLIFLAMPAVFFAGGNIVVNVFDERMPSWLLRGLIAFGSLASLCFLALMGSRAWVLAADTLVFKDETQDLAIPVFYYWLPILIGFAVSFVAQCIVLFKPSLAQGGGESV